MFETLAKYIGGKVLTIVVVFACACAGYWFYQHPEQLENLWGVIKYVFAWLAFAAVLPWAMFLVTRWVVSLESNTAAGLMLAGYVLADVVAALLLAGSGGHGILTWVVLIAGFLAAGIYNFVVCEYVATRLEDSR
jgi:hypothetical protein